jgi:ACR3 family arsenite efflux pump ArsB
MAIIAAHLYGLWKIIKRWKRAGFYWIVAACIALIGYGFIYAPSEVVSAIVTLAIYLGLTYVVLRFRNSYNAKSTWEQLD